MSSQSWLGWRLFFVGLGSLLLFLLLPLLIQAGSRPEAGFSVLDSDERGMLSEFANPDLPAPADPLPGARLSVLDSDETGMLLELVVPRYIARPVEVGGLVLDAPGLPDKTTLPGSSPAWSGLIALPPGADLQVEIIEIETELIALSRPVIPAPALDPDANGSEWDLPPADAYLQDALYPSALFSVSPPAYFRDQRVARLALYPMRVNPMQNRLEYVRRILVRIDFVGGQDPAATPALTSPSVENLLQGTLLNYDQARAWRSLPSDFQIPEPNLEIGLYAYKIEVDTDGLYRVTYADLIAAGMDVTNTNPLSFALTSQGSPVAIEWFGGVGDNGDNGDNGDAQFSPGEGFYFYGQEFRGTVMEEKYTDVNVYWLTDQGAPGPRVATVDGTPGGAPAATFYRATVRREKDLLWNPLHTDDLDLLLQDTDTWFWLESLGGSASLPITLTAIASGNYSATIRLKQFSDCRKWQDLGPGEHHVRLLFNGFLIDDQIWEGAGQGHCSVHLLSGSVSQSELLGGGLDTLTWAVDHSSTGRGEWLNWFEVEYQRQFVALEDELTFGGDLSGTWTYTLTGWSTDTVHVWDVTFPLTPTQLLSPAVSGSGIYSITFQSEHPTGTTFIAVGADRIRAPLSVAAYLPPDLDPPAGADWIAITHPDFITEVQRLADYRAGRGLRTVVVDVDDLYNLYGDGIYQPAAIRDYLAHALNWPSPAPAYALLVGDGNWNFKQVRGCSYCSPEPIYIPPYLAVVDPYQGEVPADNKYATLVGDDDWMPDIALGRLPVRTITETRLLISKIITHESQLINPLPWQYDVVLVADEYDDENYYDFANYSNVTAALLPDYLNAVKIYHDQSPYTSTDATRQAVGGAFNRGAALVSYRGHGGVQHWGGFFSVGYALTLTNTDRLPVVVSMDCLDTYFALAGSENQALSEELFRNSAGGSVGHWGSSGLGLPAEHQVLSDAFFTRLFRDGQTRFGDAALAGKLALFTVNQDNHNLHTFTLLGDPAMLLIAQPSIYLPVISRGGE